MTKYEHIDATTLSDKPAMLRSHTLPEIVHLNDPALAVMKDFTQSRPVLIAADTNMDGALNEMKINGVHVLLVEQDKQIIGLISSEDLLGEKPIRTIQENRIHRTKVTVKMLMTSIDKLAAFKLKSVRYARVGNIVESLRSMNTHYALVVDDENSNDHYCLCGMFSTWQIGRQLHTDIADSISSAQSVSELNQRKKK